MEFIKKIVLCLSIIIIGTQLKAQGYGPEIDSLITSIENTPDTSKAALYIKIGWKLRNFKPNAALEYCSKAIKYASDYKQYEQLSDAYAYSGVCFRNLGNYTEAVEFYHKGLDITQKYKMKEKQAYAYNNLGNLLLYLENYPETDKNLRKAMSIGIELQNATLLSYVYLNIGRYFMGLNNLDSAQRYIEDAHLLRVSMHDDKGRILVARRYLADINMAHQRYNEAKLIYQECIFSPETATDIDLRADASEKLSRIFLIENMPDSAIHYAKQSLELSKQVGTKYRMKNAYNAIADAYFNIKDYQGAAYNYKNELDYNDSIFNEQLTDKLFTIQYSADQAKKEAEIENLNEDAKSKRNWLFVVSSLFIIGIIMAIFWMRDYKKIGKLNKQLSFQQKEISDSITYAKQIQASILPQKHEFGTFFSEKFVIYRPKDVVSGDFYWGGDFGDYEMVMVADCTGHGVPGAFMSMLGTTSLHDIAARGIRDAGTILNELRAIVKKVLHQTESSSQKDGMDCALLVIDKKRMKMNYAGANIPLYVIRDGEFSQYKATRNPIGYFPVETDFASNEIDMQAGDCYYMASDGYTSQFSDDGKKLKPKIYQKLLLENYTKSMKEQKNILDSFLDDFRGNEDQVDDVLVAGFRV